MTDELITNILATEAFFWRSLGTVFAVRDGVIAWGTGIPNKYLNGILATDLPGALVTQAIREAGRQFQVRGVPWTWGVTPLCRPRDLERQLATEGFTALGGHPVLWHGLELSRMEPLPAGVLIQEATTVDLLQDWDIPLDQGLGSGKDPRGSFFQLTAKAPFGPGQPFHHYVVYQDGRPVACATLSVSRHGGRIDNVATCPDCRQKGYGGAVTRFALVEAQKLGCAMACLESSEDGLSLYRRLGFREACLRQVYEPSQP